MKRLDRPCLLPLLAAAVLAARSGATFAQQVPGPHSEPFPASTAIAEGVSPEALASLDELVQRLVDEGEIVGAELFVLVHDRAILHAAYGWSDLEAKVPMELDRVFCVRSMTKPLIGASVLMLVDEGKLKLSDRVSSHLPAFDVDGLSATTVEQLLTHTSGLPMSLILASDLHELDEQGGIDAVVALADASVLLSAPGEAFHYSDQGTDTLTALVAAVSGMSAADFVTERLLAPLGMRDSTCVMTEDSPLRAYALPAYAGSRNAWTRFWGPDQPALFPFFLGSQGLYSTVTDYARFLALWRDRGRAGGERLLKAGSVRKALTPFTDAAVSGSGFPGVSAKYGYLMELWSAPQADGGRKELVAFGHTGSDGTCAYAFPEQDAMALFFTQSRGNVASLRVEEALARVFLGAPFDPNEVAPPFDDYLGYYFEGEDDLYRAIVRDGEDLAYEILGKIAVPLTFAGEDRWKLRPEPATVLEFQRDDAGAVTGYRIGEHVEHRFRPSSDLPSVAELAGRVAAAHRIDLLATLGPIRTHGTLRMERVGRSGEYVTTLAWPDRFRIDISMGEEYELIAFDGATVRYLAKGKPVATLDGSRGESERLSTALARLGDWTRWYGPMEVVQELERPGEDGDAGPETVYVVRAGDLAAPARTLYVHANGRVVREDALVEIDGVGRIGQRLEFSDYRDVSGMLLPHRIETTLANPMIGAIVTTIDRVDFGVEVTDAAFRLED